MEFVIVSMESSRRECNVIDAIRIGDSMHEKIVMICQACGLDKKRKDLPFRQVFSFFGVDDEIRTHGLQSHNLTL